MDIREFQARMMHLLKDSTPSTSYSSAFQGPSPLSSLLSARRSLMTQPNYIVHNFDSITFSINSIILPLILGKPFFKVLQQVFTVTKSDSVHHYFRIFKSQLYLNEFNEALAAIDKCIAFDKEYIKWKLLTLYFQGRLSTEVMENSGIDKKDMDYQMLDVFHTCSEEKAQKLFEANEYFGSLAWVKLISVSNLPDKQKVLLAVLKRVIEKYPKNPETYFFAVKLMKKYKVPSGQKIIEAIFMRFSLMPEEYLVYVNIEYSKILIAQEKTAICIDLLQDAFKKYPAYIQILYLLGKLLIVLGRQATLCAGVSMLEEFLRFKNFNNDKARYYIIKGYLMRNQICQVLKHLALISIDRLSHVKKATIAELREKYDKELEFLASYNSSSPISLEFLPSSEFKDFYESLSFYQVKDFTEAVKRLNSLRIRQGYELTYIMKELMILKEIKDYDYPTKFVQLLTDLNGPKVIVAQWVRSFYFYAKYLFSMDCFEDSLQVLISISKIFPKFACCSSFSPFTISESHSSGFSISLVLSNLKKDGRAEAEEKLRMINENFSSPKQRRYTTQIPKPGFSKLIKEKDIKEKVFLDAPDMKKPDINMSRYLFVTLDCRFLYKIGKYSVFSKQRDIEGISALKDYKEFIGKANIYEELREKWIFRASFYLVYLYNQTGQRNFIEEYYSTVRQCRFYSDFKQKGKNAGLEEIFN